MFLPVPTWACLPRAVVVGVKPHGQVYRIGFERQQVRTAVGSNRKTPREILSRIKGSGRVIW